MYNSVLTGISAMYYFDTSTLTQNVHAARTIHAGEEITITCKNPLLQFSFELPWLTEIERS